jgi:hypothetical protein
MPWSDQYFISKREPPWINLSRSPRCLSAAGFFSHHRRMRATFLVLFAIASCGPRYTAISPFGTLCFNQCQQIYWMCANGQPVGVSNLTIALGVVGVIGCAAQRDQCVNACPDLVRASNPSGQNVSRPDLSNPGPSAATLSAQRCRDDCARARRDAQCFENCKNFDSVAVQQAPRPQQPSTVIPHTTNGPYRYECRTACSKGDAKADCYEGCDRLPDW